MLAYRLMSKCFSVQMVWVYFPDDEAVSIAKETSIVNYREVIEGAECGVKERSKVYGARVIATAYRSVCRGPVQSMFLADSLSNDTAKMKLLK